MAISQKQATALFELGHISSDLYDRLKENVDDAHAQDRDLVKYGKDDMQSQDAIPNQSDRFYPVSHEDMEAQRTTGSDPRTEVPDQESTTTAPQYQGPANKDIRNPGELSGFQRGIGAPLAPPKEEGGPGFIGPTDSKYDASRVKEGGVPWSAPQNKNTAQYVIGNPPADSNAGSITTGTTQPQNLASRALTAVGREIAPGITNAIAGKETDPKYIGPQPTEDDKKKAAEEAATKAPPGSLPTDLRPAIAQAMSGSSAPRPQPSKIPGLMNELGQTYEEQKEGLKTGAQSDIAESNQVALHQANQVQDLAMRAKEEKDKQTDEATKTTRMMNDIDAKFTSLKDVKIDPDRMWNNKSTGQKILGHLAMALGTLGGGAGRGAGVNAGVDGINLAIDRDLKAQQLDFQNGMEATKGQVGLLKDYMDVTHNRHISYEAAKLDYMQRAKGQLDSIASKFKGPQALGKYQVAAGQLDERLVEQKLKLQQAIEAAQAKGAGGGAPKGEAEDLKFVAKESLEQGIPAVRAALNDVSQQLEKGGDFMGPEAREGLSAAGNIPIIGALSKRAYGSAYPEASRNEQKLQLMHQTIRQAFTGKGFSKEESQGYQDRAIGDGTVQGMKEGIAETQRLIDAKEATIMSGIGNRENKATTRGKTPREEQAIRMAEEKGLKAAEQKKRAAPGNSGAK